jgi:hypothetical protein
MNILAQSAAARRCVAVTCGVLASWLVCGSAAAQFGPSIPIPTDLPTAMPAPPAGYPPTVAPTAAGPYYVPSAWSHTLASNARFVILSNFNNDAVLDRATGSGCRRSVMVMRHQLIFAAGLLVVGTLTLPARGAEAQTTAVGPYYATPSWDQTLACTALASCPRFVVLSNFNSEAVLDRETGLVWQRTPSTEPSTWRGAQVRCNEFVTIGNRLGWRMPTLQELVSLIDLSRSDPALPAGHPFNDVQVSGYYFTATEDSRDTGNTWIVSFAGDGDISNGVNGSKTSSHFFWCVRGGQGAVVQ